MIGLRSSLPWIAGLGIAAFGSIQSADAAQIMGFGQQSSSNTVTLTRTGSSTTISTGITRVAVTVTNYAGSTPSTPFTGYLALTATNVDAAVLNGSTIEQMYDGSFSITQNADGSGDNYLSGTFANADFSGRNGGNAFSLDATAPPDGDLTFTSSILSADQLITPRGLSFSFTNVLPPLSIVSDTVDSADASFSGTASAAIGVVPEPSTFAMAGMAVLGFAGFGIRRKLRARATA